MDELIKTHAQHLQNVYDNRTAGDFTFQGVLVEFLQDIQANCGAVMQINDRHQKYSHNQF